MASVNLRRAITCALYSGAVATPAMAQEVLEELVVTATKRAESMQDIPIAVQAMGKEDIIDTLERARYESEPQVHSFVASRCLAYEVLVHQGAWRT